MNVMLLDNLMCILSKLKTAPLRNVAAESIRSMVTKIMELGAIVDRVSTLKKGL